MKILVTGVNGQLGHDVVRALSGRGHLVVGSDRTEAYVASADGSPVPAAQYRPMDITDGEAVQKVVGEIRPDAVIHCAAWTDVDGAEENREQAFAVNAEGTKHIAQAVRELDAKMMYISTDYVFDGQGERPWRPEDRPSRPLNVYGRTKLEGEEAVSSLLNKFFIVRTAWAFGLGGKNFVQTMIRAGKTRDAVRVVRDQIGTPTYTLDLARLLADMIETERYGYYHATNEGGYISWYDFCCEIYRQVGLKTKVLPVTTSEYGLSKAVRPLNSRLDKSKLIKAGFEPLPAWQDAVHRYLKEAKWLSAAED